MPISLQLLELNPNLQSNGEIGYINEMLASLRVIEAIYVQQIYFGVHSQIQKPERAFVTELYHQLKIRVNHENAHFAVDLRKMAHLTNQYYDEIIHNPNVNYPNEYLKGLSPDIVLHSGQDNRIIQGFALEAKMDGATSKSILIDFYKLAFYKEKMNFETIYFIYSGTKQSLEQKLNNAFAMNGVNERLVFQFLERYRLIIGCREHNDWNLYHLSLNN